MLKLIPFEQGAAKFIMDCQLNPDYVRFFRDVSYFMTWDQCNNFDKVINREVFIMAIDKDPVGIATILSHPAGVSDVGMMIIKEHWGKKTSNEAYSLVEDYVFNRCSQRKICLQVLASDKHTIASNRKHEYVPEGLLKEHFIFQGKLEDVIILSKIKKRG